MKHSLMLLTIHNMNAVPNTPLLNNEGRVVAWIKFQTILRVYFILYTFSKSGKLIITVQKSSMYF